MEQLLLRATFSPLRRQARKLWSMTYSILPSRCSRTALSRRRSTRLSAEVWLSSPRRVIKAVLVIRAHLEPARCSGPELLRQHQGRRFSSVGRLTFLTILEAVTFSNASHCPMEVVSYCRFNGILRCFG